MTDFALPDRAALEGAAEIVHDSLAPTPQLRWPLLSARCGAEVWVKHEELLPTRSFKVRGGLVFARDCAKSGDGAGLLAATRGNHGQSVAFAARKHGLDATIVVPQGNSPLKNAAMEAFGAKLIVHGRDFQEAYEHAQSLADADRGRIVPSFHPLLVRGVASYALELFAAVPDLDTVYVPIGLGSGICAVAAAREALGLGTRIVGVVAQGAPCYALSFAEGRPVTTEAAETFADGLAVRVPDAAALACIRRHVDRVLAVSEAELRQAVAAYFTDAGAVAEGAAAAPLAGLLQERKRMRGRRVALILTGSNIDADVFRSAIA